MNLGAYEVLCRLATDDGVSAPVSGDDLPAAGSRGSGSGGTRTVPKRYGRTLEEIEADIAQRRTPQSLDAARSGRGWAGRRGTDSDAYALGEAASGVVSLNSSSLVPFTPAGDRSASSYTFL